MEIEDKIQRLIYLADINLAICKRIQDKYKKLLVSHEPKILFLKLTANNAFFEAVNIMHTLLCSTDDREITFSMWEKGNIKQEHIADLNKIRRDFKNAKFHRMRHNIINHKNIDIKDPLDHAYAQIHQTHVLKLSEIINCLRDRVYFWFTPPYERYDPFITKHVKGLDMILDLLDD